MVENRSIYALEELNKKRNSHNYKIHIMSRNTEKNIKKHNDKLHKAQSKVKNAEILRKEKLKLIVKKFNENKPLD